MSHQIIIRRVALLTPATSEADSEISAEITYTPSHDMTDEQIGNRVARILKKISQMSD